MSTNDSNLGPFFNKVREYVRPSDTSNIAKAIFGRSDAQGNYQMFDHEIWWRDHAAAIKANGYRLRPRFRPGWKPSSFGDDKRVFGHIYEDDLAHKIEKVIDACRLEDSTTVAVKRIARGSSEIDIAKMLSSPELLRDTLNHTVPILDSFSDPKDDKVGYIVMPLLRKFDDPEFYSVPEVLSFVRQVLEGLTFMHQHGIAHGDCTGPNIMMDGTFMYPDGFHPSHQDLTVTGNGNAHHVRRSDVQYVKYFFVDYSHSTYFVDGHAKTGRLAIQQESSDGTETEVFSIKQEDAFSADVCVLGETIKATFVDKYNHMQFLLPLVQAMIQEDQTSRLTAKLALEQFELAAKGIDSRRSLRLANNDERSLSKVYDVSK
ncbi:hypothetical protein M0805_008124 [Coniferiporia weirii]|nr:hypothetical protein M0805_008124 [Coniferiporia weirii]